MRIVGPRCHPRQVLISRLVAPTFLEASMTTERNSREHEAGPGMSPAVMAQIFRGELGRSDRWRTRLDTTTNWALTTTAAVISFGFSSPVASHVTLLVGIWMVTTFLMLEAR